MFEQRFDNKHHLVKNRKTQTAKAINLSHKTAKAEAKEQSEKFDKFVEQSKQFEIQ